MAAEFSARLGHLADADVARIRTLFEALKLPVCPPDISVDDFLAAMSIDKKVIAGEIRLVLLREIGSAEVTADYPTDDLAALVTEQLGRWPRTDRRHLLRRRRRPVADASTRSPNIRIATHSSVTVTGLFIRRRFAAWSTKPRYS
jgi:hypothetical protein